MSFISNNLYQVGHRLIQKDASFTEFIEQIEAECVAVSGSKNDKDKWNKALCLRGFLDSTLECYELCLSDDELLRVTKNKDMLLKAIIESKAANF
ncbi:MAG: hypothetical protein ACI9T7_000100 [Oleiphilaceae bacterium]|jgi:hypothetical protein